MLKNKLRFFVFFVCIVLNQPILSGAIFETPHFSEILTHIEPKTLVLLDIDDTLLIPNQTLGTDVWFDYRLNQYKEKGMSSSHALEKALADWEAVRHLTKVKIVEGGTEKIIAGLQDRNVVVMGLTTQGLALSTRTIIQLHSLGIDLALTSPSQDDHYLMNEGHGVLYRHGILFTSGSPKGKALFALLNRINFQPQKIIFINDKLSHLKDVEKEVELRGIDFIGLRYSHEDKRVANFNKKIAEVQWMHSTFGNILSDEEALKCAAY